jgi:hypothetical protein
MVLEIRRLRAEGNPGLAEAAEDLYISLLKYNVQFSDKKSLFRMKAERLLNRHKVKEIVGLVDFLHLR